MSTFRKRWFEILDSEKAHASAASIYDGQGDYADAAKRWRLAADDCQDLLDLKAAHPSISWAYDQKAPVALNRQHAYIQNALSDESAASLKANVKATRPWLSSPAAAQATSPGSGGLQRAPFRPNVPAPNPGEIPPDVAAAAEETSAGLSFTEKVIAGAAAAIGALIVYRIAT